jgi:hypothetical protein
MPVSEIGLERTVGESNEEERDLERRGAYVHGGG